MPSKPGVLRNVLRLCRCLDKDPRLLVMLLGRPTRQFDRSKKAVVRLAPAPWPFVEELLWEARGHSAQFAHPDQGHGSVRAAARRHWRLVCALGSDYCSEAEELLWHLRRAADAAKLLLDEAAVSDCNSPGGTGSAAAESRFALQRLPPSSEKAVAVGQILATHPLACITQPALDQAVIMICGVAEASQHVQGVILNKRTEVTLGDMLASDGPHAKDDMLLAENLGLHALLDAKLHVGGDIVEGQSLFHSLFWLHTLGVEAGDTALEVAPGIWLGGDLSIMAGLVQSGRASLGTDLRSYLGCAGWASEQLILELDGTTAEAFWRKVLLDMGLPALSKFPRGRIDTMLSGAIQSHYAKLADLRASKAL
eukprot:TRINITY_DN17157_c0_g1_i1.p1 TRINITY_DN17157_c0_g1~~TRINITY_DN17157_c0_g1_i1.p1  ORF type:complete len:378 (+),score=79.21 TRINITY_DN17157_c0_g1_i1:35-1135(+)